LRRTPEGPALDIWDWFAQAPDLIGEAQRRREYEVPSAITAVRTAEICGAALRDSPDNTTSLEWP
jgi:hypothetical protein